MKKINILLIEDNRLLRDGIKALINAQADLKIVASSAGDHDTLLKARSLLFFPSFGRCASGFRSLYCHSYSNWIPRQDR